MKRLIYLMVAVCFACSVVRAQETRASSTVVLDETGEANLGIATVAAEESVFATVLPVLGELRHTCESHSVVSSRIAGRVLEVLVHEGDVVEKDQLIGRIESRQAGNPPPVIELRAPAAGLVMESEFHLGGPVEPEMELMEVLDLTKLWVVAHVPQESAGVLREGLVAEIRIPVLGEELLKGEFLQLGTDADAAQGTVEGVFVIENPEGKLRPGMRAEVQLELARREGVMSVPRMAVMGERAERYVFIKDYELERAYVKAPVTVGESSGDRVEIVGGIFPGDEVVTTGAYALSFAGKGNASLKEALDAAHGHPHNEDGSEMSEAEVDAQAAGGHGHDHSHEDNGLTVFLAVACGVLFCLLVATPFVFRKNSKA